VTHSIPAGFARSSGDSSVAQVGTTMAPLKVIRPPLSACAGRASNMPHTRQAATIG
jgi:hypothetical protein